jgi:O-antigen/teichoic acid export membrane protein
VSDPKIAVSDEIHGRALPRRVFGSLLWLGSASIVGQIVSWLSAILVIRLLSPSDYGLMAMASLPVGLLMLIGDLGVGSIVVQAPTLERPRLKALFGTCLLAHLLGAAVLFVGAPLVASFFAEPRVILILRALSFSFVCLGFSALPRALMARDLQFDRRAKIDVLTALVSSFVALVLAMRGWGVWSLVGATLAMYTFRAVACQIVYPCLFLPFPALRDSVRFGGWVTLDRIIWFGYTNVDVAIAGRALGDALVGVYTVALSLASMPIDKVMSIVNEISFSAFSRMQGDRERIRSGMLRSLESVSLLAFPTFFGMAMVAPELIEAVLGPKWTGAILPLQILCIAFPFRALGVFFAPALLGTGQARLVVENNLITLVAVALAMGVGVHWGVIGLCVAWVVGYVPTFIVVARRTLAALQTPGRQVAGTIGFSMAAALAMAAAVAGARTVTGEVLPVPVELAILTLFGAGTYGAVVLAFRPRTLRTFWVLGTGK